MQQHSVCSTKAERVGKGIGTVVAQRQLGLVPVVGSAHDEDEVRHASPTYSSHAGIAHKGCVAVKKVARHTRTAPRGIGKEREARQSAELHPPGVAHLNAVLLFPVLRIENFIAGGDVSIVSGNGIAHDGKRDRVLHLGFG